MAKWLTVSFLVKNYNFGAKNDFLVAWVLQSDLLKAVLAGDAIVGSMVRHPYLLMVVNISTFPVR